MSDEHKNAYDEVKTAVIQAFKESGLRQSDLSRLMGIHHGDTRRILDPSSRTKFDTLVEVARVLGFDVKVEVIKRQE